MLEEETPNTPNEDTNSATDYIAALQELKQNSVPKADYAKLQDENRRLLKSLINGETIEGQIEEAPDIAQLRKDLFSGEGDLTNLQYVQKALELRTAIIESGGVDPFLPVGHRVTPDEEDIRAANRVAKILQECVDTADGDSAIFTSTLQRAMVDTSPKIPPKKI